MTDSMPANPFALRGGARWTGRRTAYSQRMPCSRAARSTAALSSANSVRAGSKRSHAASRGQNPGFSFGSPKSCAD
jgi:hypothetical protein